MERFVFLLLDISTPNSFSQVRSIKGEEELADLVKKSQQLEVELDKVKADASEKLNEKESALTADELEALFFDNV